MEWITSPTNYGELILFDTLNLIKQKIQHDIFSSKNYNDNLHNSEIELQIDNSQVNDYYVFSNYVQQSGDICDKIEKTQFIELLLYLLGSESECLKDISILMLTCFSNCNINP